MRKISRFLAIGLAVSVFLTGCGMESAAGFVKSQYQFESVDGADQQSKIYRAPDQTVPVTAKQIADQNHPDEESAPNNQNMFLVYPDTVIHVQQDPQKTQDSLIEVDTKQYVAQHYDPGFLQGFLAGTIISNIFGSNWRSYPHGSYRGYGDYMSRYPSGSYGGSSGSRFPSGGGYSRPPSYSKPPSYTPPKSGGGFFTPPRSGGGTGRVIKRGGR